MAISVEYCCGCTFNTKDVEEAQKHSNERGHKLWAQGMVVPEPVTAQEELES